MNQKSENGSVPRSALLLSGLCLALPLVAVAVVPEWMEGEGALLVWVPALIPGFLLAYHKGWTGASQALAGGMAALVLSHVEILLLDVARPPFEAIFGVIVLLVVVAVGSGWLADLLSRERRAAEQMALTDQLTRIANRRHAMIFLEAVWAAARRGSPLSVVIFDVDDFKRVNDRHGHAAGDEVLRSFGRVLAERTRAMDLSARLGGEEFVSILVDCAIPDAARFADEVRGMLAALDQGWGSVTASAGVAEHTSEMSSPEEMLAAADRALYAAKEAGRDRVRRADLIDLAGPEPAAPAGPAEAPDPGTRKPRALEEIIVLLVDDDPGVLRATRRALERLGCRVEAFTSPFDAVKHVQERRVAPHVLVTDVVMPEMSGFALVDMMGRLVRGVPVLYVSGYDQREMYWSGAPGARSALLGKPYTPAELEQALLGLLEVAGGLAGEPEPARRASDRSDHAHERRDPPSPGTRPDVGTPALAGPLHNSRILIVDDDATVLRSLKRLFEQEGFTFVRCALDPVEALETARTWRPDLVLADIHMPHMDGLELMSELADLVRHEDFVPFIVLTGDEDREVRRRALERGATDFLTKPLDGHE
ncbi:MAG TPA: response regulator, partial [Longimicrobiales bacterium]|nr:response regulator [Longimicrobiales bacterium]